MLEQGDLSSVAVEWDKLEYWDEQSLDKELRRQYDVCNSCRLCFNLCPCFPKLFESFDKDEAAAAPDKLTKDQVWEFVGLRYNCKLCFIKRPYTPPHKFLIDIPKLVMRARAVEAERDGVNLAQRVARGLHRGVNESEADIIATDCALAGLQIRQGTARVTLRPVEVLAKAYGIEEEEK